MKNRFILGIAILLASAGVHAGDCNLLPKQDASEATIKDLEKQWSRAFYTGDAEFLDQMRLSATCCYATQY